MKNYFGISESSSFRGISTINYKFDYFDNSSVKFNVNVNTRGEISTFHRHLPYSRREQSAKKKKIKV